MPCGGTSALNCPRRKLGGRYINPPQPVGGKKIAAPSAGKPIGGTDHEPPAFCFKHVQNGFDIAQLEDAEKVAFADKLDRLSKRTWLMIKQESRYKNGSEIIARKSLKKPIPSAATPDVEFISFHLPGLFRVIGWRSERVLHVTWVDPKGRCYSH